MGTEAFVINLMFQLGAEPIKTENDCNHTKYAQNDSNR